MKPRTKNILVVIAILAVTFIPNKCNAQTKIQINTIYNLDRNPDSKNPFEEKDVQIVKVLQIKQGYVQYQIIKAWCCIGEKFSTTLDVFSWQVDSYKNKYSRPYKTYTKQKSQY